MPHTEAPDLLGLGNFIRHRRHTLGLTQTQLGDRVGIRQGRVSILEGGTYGAPSLKSLARLGCALETSLTKLLGAAGYTGLTVCATGETGSQHNGDNPPSFEGSELRESWDDAVEATGLSALLAPEPGLECLRLTLRCNGHAYHATIQTAGSDWLLTLLDDELVRTPAMIGDVLISRERAVLTALLEVLRASLPRPLDREASGTASLDLDRRHDGEPEVRKAQDGVVAGSIPGHPRHRRWG